MQLTHKLALCPTPEQVNYFVCACGTARFVWNWALDQWHKQRAAGHKPNAMALKKQFNAIKYNEFPWLKDIHRDAHAQPFVHLARGWSRFFADIKAGKPAHEPRFKKKGRCRDSFYVANDKFCVSGNTIRLPKLGVVRMTEALRLEGKILGATVSRTADRWFVAISVEVPDRQCYRTRKQDGITGVDLGVKAAATLSSGETIEAPKPLKAALRRLKIRGRRVSRKLKAAKLAAGFASGARLPKGAKLTTRLCRDNQAVAIEDLNVKGMLANNRLARAVSDVGFNCPTRGESVQYWRRCIWSGSGCSRGSHACQVRIR